MCASGGFLKWGHPEITHRFSFINHPFVLNRDLCSFQQPSLRDHQTLAQLSLCLCHSCSRLVGAPFSILSLQTVAQKIPYRADSLSTFGPIRPSVDQSSLACFATNYQTWMVSTGKSQSRIDDLVAHLFQETSIYWYPQIGKAVSQAMNM